MDMLNEVVMAYNMGVPLSAAHMVVMDRTSLEHCVGFGKMALVLDKHFGEVSSLHSNRCPVLEVPNKKK